MSAYARNSKLAAYHGVSIHGGVAGADPHHLILMLMDGASERLSIARGCMERGCAERGDLARKAAALHQCITIVAELRGSLNLSDGGTLAQNLGDLYDYMVRRLLRANADNDVACVTEVFRLLEEIRGAWAAIGPEVRQTARTGVPPEQNATAALASAQQPRTAVASGNSRG